MKKTALLFILFLALSICNQPAFSADEPNKTEDAYLSYLIKSAPGQKDFPGISAVYLLLEEKDYINVDCTATYEVHMIWKMLDNQAIPLGEVSIPFNASMSSLDVVLARTIKPDNTVVNVAQENIREVTPYSSFPMYSNIRIKQFSMPAMEINSVFEYKVVLKLFKPDMPGFFYTRWSFPPGLPVILSTFEVDTPEGLNTNFVSKNLNATPEVSTPKGRKIYKWTAKNIFIGGIYEQMLPPYDMVCPNLTFVALKKWQDFSGWFYGMTDSQLGINPEIKDFVDGVAKRNGKDRQKIMNDLYSFVSKEVRYVRIPLKSSEYQPHKVTDIYTNKYGDCKDKSALLIALYRVAGIDANFALLRSRSQGPLIADFPAFDFNHCIVAVPKEGGGYIFLDPTLELNKFGYIPTEMQGVDILVVKKGGYEFVKVPFEQKNISGTKIEEHMNINSDYVINVDENDTYFGDTEIMARMNVKYATQDSLKARLEQVLKSMYTKGTLTTLSFSDPDDLNQQFNSTFKYEIREHIKEAGNLLIFDLPGSKLNMIVSTEKRHYPIWFPSLNEETSIINITMPPNCKINYLPPNIEKDTPFGYYKRDISTSGDKISIQYYYNLKVLEIPVDQYEKYKEFIEYMVKTSKESIILEKI